MTPPVLRVRNVGWRVATVPVLDHVSFDVAPGEFVAVMGRNGAGKSTLLDIVAGLRAPTEGAVTLAGRALDEMTALERARTLAHLPQSLRADLSMRAEALVLMGRYAHADRWFESDEDRRIAEEAMQRCGCLEFRWRTLSTLSGGERQRVFLAACLAQRAPVLLLDEPATFLDVDQQLQCFNVLRAEADRGTACVAVTHDAHLLRGRLGGDDRMLMPCAFLLGGVLLASCDALGRVLLAPAEIPAGAITACIGGPYLIWVVRRGGMR